MSRFERLPDWLAWLETLHPKAIDMGLGRVRAVGARLGVLAPGVPVVTVTGTNGKGSTTAILDALLRAHGLRTALYTSPHILRFNERIVLDGRPVADADLVRALAQVDAARGDTSLTYFEFTTLAAFVLFREAAPDAWVLEVGLGGRLDAVNIIDADVAVLTAVGLDHAEYLGNTRESVGREKAGIFRAGRPAVVADRDPPPTVAAEGARIGATLLQAGHDWDYAAAGGQWDFRGPRGTLEGLPLPVLAVENAATALCALQLLPFALQPAAVAQALRTVRLAGRNQRIDHHGRALVLDVGHNPHALEFLRGQLARHGLGTRFHVVLGMLADKDIPAAVRALEGLAQSWHSAPLPVPRSADAVQLRAALAGSQAPATLYADIAGALAGALGTADGLPLLVAGSFHTVAEALAALGIDDIRAIT